jgi:hypothetical protein
MAANFVWTRVIRGIFIWAKFYRTTEDVNKLLLSTDNVGRTIFHMAANFCGLGVLE